MNKYIYIIRISGSNAIIILHRHKRQNKYSPHRCNLSYKSSENTRKESLTSTTSIWPSSTTRSTECDPLTLKWLHKFSASLSLAGRKGSSSGGFVSCSRSQSVSWKKGWALRGRYPPFSLQPSLLVGSNTWSGKRLKQKDHLYLIR